MPYTLSKKTNIREFKKTKTTKQNNLIQKSAWSGQISMVGRVSGNNGPFLPKLLAILALLFSFIRSMTHIVHEHMPISQPVNELMPKISLRLKNIVEVTDIDTLKHCVLYIYLYIYISFNHIIPTSYVYPF